MIPVKRNDLCGAYMVDYDLPFADVFHPDRKIRKEAEQKLPRNLENYCDDDGDLIWWESTDEELFMAVVGDTTSNPGISYRGNAELYFSLLRELSDRDLIPELHMELKRMIRERIRQFIYIKGKISEKDCKERDHELYWIEYFFALSKIQDFEFLKTLIYSTYDSYNWYDDSDEVNEYIDEYLISITKESKECKNVFIETLNEICEKNEQMWKNSGFFDDHARAFVVLDIIST